MHKEGIVMVGVSQVKGKGEPRRKERRNAETQSNRGKLEKIEPQKRKDTENSNLYSNCQRWSVNLSFFVADGMYAIPTSLQFSGSNVESRYISTA